VLNRLDIRNAANTAWLDNSGTMLPSFWGATQGAPMRVGDSTAINAEVKCSASSTGSGTATNITGYENVVQDFLPDFDPGDTDFSDPIWVDNTPRATTGVSAAGCAFVVSVTVAVCSWDADHAMVCDSATWTGDRYLSHPPYTDEPPDVTMCQLFPANPNCVDVVEPELACAIYYTDPSDPFAVIAEFFGGIPQFFSCLIVPQGWDRSGAIARAWEGNPIYQAVYAYGVAMPTGMSCGVVGTIPNVDGSDLTLNTCGLDVLDDGWKSVIGFVLTLGIGGLIGKRILWSLGGDSAPRGAK